LDCIEILHILDCIPNFYLQKELQESLSQAVMMAQPTSLAGLMHKDDSVPLKDVSVRARIQGYLVSSSQALYPGTNTA